VHLDTSAKEHKTVGVGSSNSKGEEQANDNNQQKYTKNDVFWYSYVAYLGQQMHFKQGGNVPIVLHIFYLSLQHMLLDTHSHVIGRRTATLTSHSRTFFPSSKRTNSFKSYQYVVCHGQRNKLNGFAYLKLVAIGNIFPTHDQQ
jgi:hypothetical protein